MNVDTMMHSLSRGILRYRWALLAFIAVTTWALLYATKDLVVDNDFDNWLPENDRVSELYRLVDEQFTSYDSAAQMIKAHDRASQDYLKHYYDIDWDDPLLYHLVINTGIACRRPGVGQIGAGLTAVPIECFEKALEAFAAMRAAAAPAGAG